MKLTKRQEMERKNLEWFCDPNDPLGIVRFGLPNDEAFREYLDWSERGKPIKSKFNFYSEAKRRRGVTIHELWEPSFYDRDGSWPGFDGILRNEDGTLISKDIAEFIAYEIFGGQDHKKIMKHYDFMLKKVGKYAKIEI